MDIPYNDIVPLVRVLKKIFYIRFNVIIHLYMAKHTQNGFKLQTLVPLSVSRSHNGSYLYEWLQLIKHHVCFSLSKTMLKVIWSRTVDMRVS